MSCINQPMTARILEVLIWVLIYGGLIGACLGLALLRRGGPVGLLLVSGAAAALGFVLIFARSRMKSK